MSNVWIDPTTGTMYDKNTMTPLTTAGDNLGEIPKLAPTTNISENEITNFLNSIK